MSTPSWQPALHETLSRLNREFSPQRPRVAVVGIGHDLRGDDGAGVAVARLLHLELGSDGPVQVVVGGHAPENQVGALRRLRPALVLLVDAADMGAAPGSVRWLDWHDTTGFSASTHTLPPHVLAQYLTLALGCEVALLGIQPGDTALGAPFTAEVWQAVLDVTEALLAVFGAGVARESEVSVK